MVLIDNQPLRINIDSIKQPETELEIQLWQVRQMQQPPTQKKPIAFTKSLLNCENACTTRLICVTDKREIPISIPDGDAAPDPSSLLARTISAAASVSSRKLSSCIHAQ